MKSLTVSLLLTLEVASVCAQGAFTNHTLTALQQVIGDYPHHFRNIKGPVISEDLQTTDYASFIKIPGAVTTVITRHNSPHDKQVYSWKSVMFTGEDFDAVARKYRELYSQIRNSIIKIEGEKPFILNGTYGMPAEEKKFAASAFYLLPPSGELRKLKVELTMESYITEWKVSLQVYDQEEEEVVMD